jgi:predicted ester cyclase
MPSENEIAVGKFWDAFWTKGDESVAEEIFATSFRDLDAQWPGGADGGIDAMKEKLAFFRGAIPDFQFTVLKQLVVDDHVVCHWKGDGTQQGEFGGVAPTGKPVIVDGISIFTCRNGQIVEQVISYDVLGMLQQIGATTIPT